MDPQDPGRNALSEATVVVFERFRFDRRTLLLSRDGDVLPVQPKPLAVLRCLVDRPGEVLLKGELLDLVWQDAAVTENSLAEAVRMLRQALGDDPKSPTYIETVHRRGYRFVAEVRTPEAINATAEHVSQRGDLPEGESTPLLPGAAPENVRSRPAWRAHVGTVATFVTGGAFVAAAMWLAAGPLAPADKIVFTLEAPDGGSFFTGAEALVVSPDGDTLVFMANDPGDGSPTFFARRLDKLDTPPLAHTVERRALHPFFSPDGQRVGLFFASGSLEVLDLGTGVRHEICLDCTRPLGRSGGADFGPDGSIVFAHDGKLWRVAAVGDSPEPVHAPQPEGPAPGYWWPSFLPAGEWIVVTVLRGHDIDGAQLAAVHLPTGEVRSLLENAVSGRFVPSGHLVFARDGELWAVSFDPDLLQPTGQPALIPSEGVQMAQHNGFAGFSVSQTGVLTYHPGDAWRDEHQIVWRDAEGGSELAIADPALFESTRLSPDGSRLAVCVRETAKEVRVYDLADQGHFRIGATNADVCDPVWSPDGSMVAYSIAGRGIFIQEAVPLSTRTPVVDSTSWLQPMDWTVSGDIVYLAEAPDGGPSIRTVNERGRDPRPLPIPDGDATTPRVSPDGNWMAYSVDATNRDSPLPEFRLKLVPFPEGEPAIDIAAGMWPVWAPDGRELYFYQPGRGWMAAPLQGDDDLLMGEPRPLGIRLFAGGIQPHGDRFLQLEMRVRKRPPTTQIVVETNWFETLRALAPPER